MPHHLMIRRGLVEIHRDGEDLEPLRLTEEEACRRLLAFDEMMAVLQKSLPQLRWANIHGSRWDELIAEVEGVITEAKPPQQRPTQ